MASTAPLSTDFFVNCVSMNELIHSFILKLGESVQVENFREN